jgi:hypothetical protein
MLNTVGADVDFIEELQMRRWAREHYVPRPERQTAWHPIVHDEMEKKDFESNMAEIPVSLA